MSTWFSPYELESANALNSRTELRKYHGALIRVGSGFGCLHPWQELGDPSLEDCLEDLAGERKLRLVRRALDCAELDGKAREDGRSLFEGLVIPGSHFLMPEITGAGLEDAIERGFEVVKVKAGREVAREMESVRDLVQRFPELKWRIDFNETGNCDELGEILSGWGGEELERLDFFEDPSLFDAEEWKKLPVAVANDRAMSEDDGRSEVLVVKPAVEEIPENSTQRIVVTSYLDHPLGQCFAAYEAGKGEILEICGLQSHGVFASNRFSEALGEVGPQFRVPEGNGLGFKDLLEGLNWEKC